VNQGPDCPSFWPSCGVVHRPAGDIEAGKRFAAGARRMSWRKTARVLKRQLSISPPRRAGYLGAPLKSVQDSTCKQPGGTSPTGYMSAQLQLQRSRGVGRLLGIEL
jgi:hypothetical protein